MKAIRTDLPRLKQAFFYTLIFSLAAHAYLYFSLAPSHDSMNMLISGPDYTREQLLVGRFAEPLYRFFRGDYPVPWLTGMLSMIFLAASVFLVTGLLDIRDRLSVALLCGLFAASPTVTATNATYNYCTDVYAMALLLACAGVWLWQTRPGWGFLAAIPLFALSMGLYQSYIDAAIGLALILLMKAAIEGEDFSRLWRRAVRYAISLLGGAVLYFLVMKLSLLLARIDMTDTRDDVQVLLSGGAGALLKLLPQAWAQIFGYFLGGRSYNSPLFRLASGALALAAAWLWLDTIIRRRIRGGALAVLLLSALLLPLGLDFIYLLALGNVHDLMSFPFLLAYAVFLLPLRWEQRAEQKPPRLRRFCGAAVVCLCAFTVLYDVVLANDAYYYKQIVSEASNQYAFSIVERIESSEDYEPGVTPVAFVGQLHTSYMARSTDDFPRFRHMTGMWNSTAINLPRVFASYCRNVLGHPANVIQDEAELDRIAQLPGVGLLAVFPKEGCCGMVDGIMVIRLE